jgi:hypothetical protein
MRTFAHVEMSRGSVAVGKRLEVIRQIALPYFGQSGRFAEKRVRSRLRVCTFIIGRTYATPRNHQIPRIPQWIWITDFTYSISFAISSHNFHVV